jgi:peptidoglycan hydrolase-like protein with peptidoglycan-binding domain
VTFWNLPLAISGGDFVKKLVVAIIAAASLFAVMTLSATAQADKTAAISQLNMAGVPDLDRDNVRQVQDALEAKGLDPGPIDGIAGPRTKAAIRKFQNRFGMKASGEIDNQTLFALGKVELATGH